MFDQLQKRLARTQRLKMWSENLRKENLKLHRLSRSDKIKRNVVEMGKF